MNHLPEPTDETRTLGAERRSPSECPDFDLAPLTRFSRDLIGQRRNPADGLVLVMALAFNEVKDVQWMSKQLERCPQVQAVTPAYGQWLGMRLHLTRQFLRVLHELLKAISDAKKAGALNDPYLREAIAATSARTQQGWQEIAALADNASKHRVGHFIMKVRNKVASHFDRNALLEGYRGMFLTNAERGEHNDCALASLGNEFRESRFFFADAAAQQAVVDEWGGRDYMFEVNDYALHAIRAIGNIVEAYLYVKAQKGSSQGSSA